jgi:hypothetical protein
VHVIRGGKKVAWVTPASAGSREDKNLLVLFRREVTARKRALEELSSLLLNLNEFVYID